MGKAPARKNTVLIKCRLQKCETQSQTTCQEEWANIFLPDIKYVKGMLQIGRETNEEEANNTQAEKHHMKK